MVMPELSFRPDIVFKSQARKVATTMNNNRTCVIRKVNGFDQYVPVNEVFDFEPSDRVFTGAFRDETENTGPSGSHKRTICVPLGTPVGRPIGRCVLRDVNGIMQWVPLGEVPESLRVAGERMLVGFFASDTVKAGPSGSHRRTICTPQRYTETRLSLN